MSSVASSPRILRRWILVALASILTLLTTAPAANAYPDGPWLVPNKPYVTTSQWVAGNNITIGDLADPNVYVENGTYYAYGTTGGGRNVPLITSKDLKTGPPTSATLHPELAPTAALFSTPATTTTTTPLPYPANGQSVREDATPPSQVATTSGHPPLKKHQTVNT